MTGDFAGHLLGSVYKVEAGKDGFEPGLGDGCRISTGGAHGTEDLGSLAVLDRRYLFEVRERPVEFVAIDMVDLHAGCTRCDESLPDEMVAKTGVEIGHASICRSTLMGIRRCRIIVRF